MIHIVLYEPEKPDNTGNIMRTCMAFSMRLHIIEPITFSLDDKHLKRAGMDYIDKMIFNTYKNYDEFLENEHGHFVFFSRYGLKTFDECDFTDVKDDEDIYLIFGKESTGIPKEILKKHLDEVYRFPMREDARSLNLSNCVAIASYECLRQTGFKGLSRVEVIKGADWILK